MTSPFLFGEQDMTALCAMGQQRVYRSGERLFDEGDESDHVILIRQGRVKISSVSPAGYEAVLAVRSAGEIVGEISALDGRPRSASVLALDDVDGVLVSGDRFRAFLRANPDAALDLLSSAVARLLLDLADRFGSRTPDAPGVRQPHLGHGPVSGWPVICAGGWTWFLPRLPTGTFTKKSDILASASACRWSDSAAEHGGKYSYASRPPAIKEERCHSSGSPPGADGPTQPEAVSTRTPGTLISRRGPRSSRCSSATISNSATSRRWTSA